MANKKQRIDLVLHLLLGSTLILKGYDKFSHHNIIGGLILLFGVIVLSYALYMVLKKRHSTTMHILVHLFEAVVSLFIAYIFFTEGKKYIQYGFILAAIGFFIAAYVSFVNRRKEHS